MLRKGKIILDITGEQKAAVSLRDLEANYAY